MTTYSSIRDLTEQEVRPAILSDPDVTPEQATAIADEVTTRLQAAGLVVWDDGWDEHRGVHWLPAQGFRMVERDDEGAAFWAIVVDVMGDEQ